MTDHGSWKTSLHHLVVFDIIFRAIKYWPALSGLVVCQDSINIFVDLNEGYNKFNKALVGNEYNETVSIWGKV